MGQKLYALYHNPNTRYSTDVLNNAIKTEQCHSSLNILRVVSNSQIGNLHLSPEQIAQTEGNWIHLVDFMPYFKRRLPVFVPAHRVPPENGWTLLGYTLCKREAKQCLTDLC